MLQDYNTTTETPPTMAHHHSMEDDDVEVGRSNSNRRYKRHLDRAVIQLPMGFCLRGKYQIKAALQTVLFVSLVAGYGALYMWNGNNNTADDSQAAWEEWHADNHDVLSSSSVHRVLQSNETTAAPTEVSCADIEKAEPAWLAVFYSIGILYMFLALAIACDEFFVPALEEMAGPHRLNLSMDVAGTYYIWFVSCYPCVFRSAAEADCCVSSFC